MASYPFYNNKLLRENIGYWIQYKFRIQTDVYELPNDRIDKLEKATFKLNNKDNWNVTRIPIQI